jgi:hypothetical protein
VYGDGWAGLPETTYLDVDGSYCFYTSSTSNCYFAQVNSIDNGNHWHVGTKFWQTSGYYHQHICAPDKLAGKPAGNYALYCISSEYTYMHWDGTSVDVLYDPPPPSASVVITNPTSGTTITSNSSIIYVSYYSLPFGTLGYGYLHIEMQNKNSGIYSAFYSHQLTSSNGSFSFPVSEFEITENGEWDLKAQQELDANTFWELTPDPAYILNFNVEGNSTPYTFANFDNWYSEHAAGGYTEPSDWAESLTAFIQPIFTSAGEFVNNSLAYFHSTDFYSKGNQLGIVFPTTQAYLNKINIFFGGFPLIQFFELLTFVMLGIFIVRTIFKFIPFFG